MEIKKFSEMISEIIEDHNLESNLSRVLREIESNIKFQSMGIFLKVQNTELFRLKIARNISHSFAKNTIFSSGDSLIEQLQNLKTIDCTPPSVYKMEYEYSDLLIIPLHFDKELFGLFFIDRESGQFDEKEKEALTLYTYLINMIIKIHQQQSEIEQHKDLYETTIVYTYKPFMSRGELLFSLMQRYKRDISLAVMKIENVKESVRTIGEHKTNEHIKKSVSHLKNNLRETDLIGRIYKDTYAVLMPETSLKNAALTVRRVDALLQEIAKKFIITFGWGITDYEESITSLSDFLKSSEDLAFEALRKSDDNVSIIDRT
jgi:diguanylate cyclase (GGDEF)-like protein